MQFTTSTKNQTISVFNEDYIQQKIRLKDDGLGTIVMFGKQAELETLIEKKEAEFNSAHEEQKKIEEKYAQYDDANSLTSPKYYLEQMNSTLSGDENWAGRERLINDGKRNASVSDSTYELIVAIKPSQSFDQVRIDYNKYLGILKDARSENAKIVATVPITVSVPDIEEKATRLLNQLIEKPELSEREQYLLSLVTNGKEDRLDDMKKTFSTENASSCPFCLQIITPEYREELSASIEKVLSRIVDEHKSELKNLLLDEVTISFEPFSQLDEHLVGACKQSIEILNKAITTLNGKILEKNKNPFSPIELEPLDIASKISSLEANLSALEKARISFNKQLDDISGLQNTLHQLNNNLAYYEIFNSYESYLKWSELKSDTEKELEEKRVATAEIMKARNDLMLQKKSVSIAIDLINASLRYVFFSANRLEIEANADSTVYTLKSNGVNVKPSEISVGERNILALCYFFVEMLDGQELDKTFSVETMVVLDDPISSFDHENRVGIMTLLRKQFECILLGNANSHIVCMTHDLQAVFDIKKAFKDICEVVKNRKSFGCSFSTFELRNNNLYEFKYNNRNEYSEIMADVYKYALIPADNISLQIGNEMRRLLEAFATFTYREGIEIVSKNDDVLSTLNDNALKKYFNNLMYRLVLHGESHSSNRVLTLTDDNSFFEMLSEEEKQRTAKDIICFLYFLNPLHVSSHLKKAAINDFEPTINEWCERIRVIASGL